jgi:hypothetical protein
VAEAEGVREAANGPYKHVKDIHRHTSLQVSMERASRLRKQGAPGCWGCLLLCVGIACVCWLVGSLLLE